ncbi:MAG: MFS transporter, partial [Anaerolineales bacterium]
MTHHSPIATRHFRRNWIAFLGDYVFFGLGLTFASTSTTMPAFAATLTSNKALIGLVSSVWLGGWLLPQVLGANYLSNKPRKYPILIWSQVVGRPMFALFVVWLLAGGAQFRLLTFAVFVLALTIFVVTDALAALTWFDLLGKALAAETRGRLIGLGQVITGLSAIGVGVWIQRLLGPSGPGYPLNYAIIFGLAALCYGFSLLSCLLIVEPPEAVAEARPSLRAYVPQLLRLWRADNAFSRVTVVRLLSGMGGLATAFYVVYATQELGLPASSIGLFAAATTLGSAVAGIVLGLVADRAGSQRVVQITTWCAFTVPVLALLMQTGLLRSALPWL